MESNEIKRKIRICNQMIAIHSTDNSIFSKNCISTWRIKRSNLINSLKTKNNEKITN